MKLQRPTPAVRTVTLAALTLLLALAGEWYTARLRGRDEVACTVPDRAPAVLTTLPEASGVALSRRTPGVLWVVNDSGDPVVTAVGPDGAVKGRVHIAGALVRDWEAIAVAACGRGGSCLYIGDIGDNRAQRAAITVYRTPEPLPADKVTAAVQSLSARFPDEPHDTEAMFITPDGGIFVITKDRPAGVFRFPTPERPGTVVTLQQVGFIPTENVTDASTSIDGQFVAVRTKEVVMFFRTTDIINGEVEYGAPMSVVSMHEPQGEGVAVGNAAVYLAGEGGQNKQPGTLAALPCRFPAAADGKTTSGKKTG
jgi:hypothetical protein